MAQRAGEWGQRFRFLIRFLGLTGAFAAVAGAVLATVDPVGRSLDDWQAALQGGRGGEPQVIAWLVTAGGSLALLAALIEAVTSSRRSAARRGAAGVSVAVQVTLAALLLFAVNFVSFNVHRRADWTRDQRFTLPAELAAKLGQLTGETVLVVDRRFGTPGSAGTPDALAHAAGRQIAGRVRDLAGQFGEPGNAPLLAQWERMSDRVRGRVLGRPTPPDGPRFRVIELDPEADDFDRELAAARDASPALAAALDAATADSLYAAADGQVRRVPFGELVQLDRAASQEGRNLVLRSAGAEPLADAVLNLESRPPTAGYAPPAGEPMPIELRQLLEGRGYAVRQSAQGVELLIVPVARRMTEAQAKAAGDALEAGKGVLFQLATATPDPLRLLLPELGAVPAAAPVRFGPSSAGVELGQGRVAAVGPDVLPPADEEVARAAAWLAAPKAGGGRETAEWRYPRADLDGRSRTLWRWVALLGLPALFAYAGLVRSFLRRMR